MYRLIPILFFFLFSCEQYNLPKKKAYLAHQFKVPLYKSITNNCPYSFQLNSISKINFDSNCNAKINNELLEADLFISNIKIKNNLELIKNDFNLKIADNSNKVSNIVTSEFNNYENKVYALYYSFVGDAPSNIQFYITDSISNFVTGSLYFNSKPNYDSLLPSISYMKNDIKKIIETFQWK